MELRLNVDVSNSLDECCVIMYMNVYILINRWILQQKSIFHCMIFMEI